ncbi:Asp-tRNA(Asn)/Glu-tRNA(Gln) amidotransferase subunit GatB [Mycoplasma bovis]|uniref:Asp-tRNA(Asn)/Glu-tRNA(Gln) amidotransferase subunit GatB n=1 Tax=Mycoplasmopsis bovis TaxID=28903 RepID=UPI001BDEA37C|nr:Asp-tRNA(Asn)/Glu-tRNA(Gln) amidotransferase subunit GatB [Mycoplasmopsis bovis]MBT1327185.1 Asp-tRNA(Asn)/Glu-tRNA(Gln) amidotransferase subunit GatB [Mycoplasmopsis bovis]MBT1334856.1 Asp-tRNA(Asn)/Glu-tRNA(Gln) amidotransferase subunit GatB [Mycoplasmopsis bovis]MBT1404567.1 Asp-tRNA(Asn)/Glu-tRNA(Gln) amidotransferase subunit GatB [Mycoplasmopsis bovis]MBT1406845.1 Asp-tRNA(Asn)/Glu-tRNA(Gln) amidotransferase subunit GatB [Mycoplasmopsis bovis]
MNNFETIIGIEIHLELNTKTKMFSPSKIDFEADANTTVNQIDLGYPGTLPLLNKEAVISGVKLAKALSMTIDNELHFDRKNYFYPDLPKGYQITQFYRPIGSNGRFVINTESGSKKINIERIHLEEDTARQYHGEKTKLDYNRAGVPLIEIVSYPEISSADEAVAYVDMIRRIALSLGISSAKMEQGSLRADVNISLRPKGYKGFGTKVEIKNMNSFRAIRNAIDYEIKLQTQKILTNEPILQQTKRYDEESMSTVVMRTKTGTIDYKYFPEPNIPFIKLSDEFINNVKLNELPWEKEERYKNEGIQDIYIKSLINDIELANYFDSINYFDRSKLSKLFFAEVVSLANSKNVKAYELGLKPQALESAIGLLDDEVISGKSFKKLVPLLINYDGDLNKLIKENNLEQISDEQTITKWIDDVIEKNGTLVAEYTERSEKVIKFVLGNVMMLSGGKVNPQKANDLLMKLLNKKFKQ